MPSLAVNLACILVGYWPQTRVLLKFFSLRDESGCDVEKDNEDFRKSKEGVPEMFVNLLASVHCRNREYFSNDIISVSDP